jgi:hypothetical protein
MECHAMKRIRYFKIVLKCFLTLIILVIAAHAIATAYYGWQVRREITKLANAGRLTPTPPAPEAVPDDDNAAIFIQQAYSSVLEDQSDGAWRNASLDPELQKVIGVYLMPSYYTEKQITRLKSPSQLSMLRQRLQTIRDLLQRAAACRQFRWTRHVGREEGDVSARIWAQERCIYFLRMHARLAVEDHRIGDALADYHLGFELADRLRKENALIPQLFVYFSTQRALLIELQQALTRARPEELSDAQLADIASMASLCSSEDLRADGLAAVDHEAASYAIPIFEDPQLFFGPHSWWARAAGRPFWLFSELWYLQQMARAREAIHSDEIISLPREYTLGRSLFPTSSLEALSTGLDRHRTRQAIALTAIAALRMRIASGHFPSGLDQLPCDRIDPTTHLQLVYQPASDGFTISAPDCERNRLGEWCGDYGFFNPDKDSMTLPVTWMYKDPSANAESNP